MHAVVLGLVIAGCGIVLGLFSMVCVAILIMAQYMDE